METFLLLLGGAVAGATGKAAIDWIRFRKLDAANAFQQHADAMVKIHDSDANALTVSSSLVALWMQDASEARQKVIWYHKG